MDRLAAAAPRAGRRPNRLPDVPATTLPDPLAGLAPARRTARNMLRSRIVRCFGLTGARQSRNPPTRSRHPTAEESDLAGFDLTGVIISPAMTTAWVKDPSQQTPVRLRAGETLAGWTVREILGDRLVVERQGKSDTLYLRDFKSPSRTGVDTASAAPPRVTPPSGGTAEARGRQPPARRGRQEAGCSGRR